MYIVDIKTLWYEIFICVYLGDLHVKYVCVEKDVKILKISAMMVWQALI